MNKRAMLEAVTKCVDHFGAEILLEKARFKAAISDFLPTYANKEERDWIFISVDIFDLGSVLLKVPPENYQFVYKSAFDMLKDRGVNDETSDAILQVFTGALKWGVPPLWTGEPDTSVGGQSSVGRQASGSGQAFGGDQSSVGRQASVGGRSSGGKRSLGGNRSFGGGQSSGGSLRGSCSHGDINFVTRRCSLCNKKMYGVFDAGKYIDYEDLDKSEGGGVLFRLGDYSGTLVLPDHLRSIGDNAFAQHKNLQEVVFPASLNSIGKFAFEGCSSLKRLVLPDALRKIGEFAFADCTSLRSVNLPGYLRNIEKGAFSGCSRLKLTVPSSVVSIGNDAFAGVQQVTRDVLPSGGLWGAHGGSPGFFSGSSYGSAQSFGKRSKRSDGVNVLPFIVIGIIFIVSLIDKCTMTPTPKQAPPPAPAASQSAAPSAPALELCAVYKDKQAGETFEFGAYPQGTNGEAKPITWRVLRRSKNALLVVSEYALAAKPYHEKDCGVTWADCSLRRWLNGTFLQKAFTESERSLIKNSRLDNNAGAVTVDRVFLLSTEEARKLFAGKKARSVIPTPYAVKYNAFSSGGSTWHWLRSRGADADRAAYVDYDGSVYEFGGKVSDKSVCVRPAFEIRL